MNDDDETSLAGARAPVTAADRLQAEQLAGHQATAQGNLITARLDALTATPPHLPNTAVFHQTFSQPPAAEEDVPLRGSLQPIRPGESHPLGTISAEAALGQPTSPQGLEGRARPSDYGEEYS